MSIEKYTWDGQDSKVVEKVHGKIVDMLTSGEYISYIALQKKPAVTLFPDSITLSNKRIFLCEFAKLGLATNFEIYSWNDIKDISFKEEIFGSKVTVIPFTGENLTVDYIPKVQARKLYQLIKESLENKANNHRQQESENITPLHTPHPEPAIPSPIATQTQQQEEEKSAPDKDVSPSWPAVDSYRKEEEEDETTKKLTRLKNLFDRQLISQAEYESKKAEILKDL